MSLGVTENCDMQCAGNANETCGGALALDVYEIMDRYWEVPGGAVVHMYIYLTCCSLMSACIMMVLARSCALLPRNLPDSVSVALNCTGHAAIAHLCATDGMSGR